MERQRMAPNWCGDEVAKMSFGAEHLAVHGTKLAVHKIGWPMGDALSIMPRPFCGNATVRQRFECKNWKCLVLQEARIYPRQSNHRDHAGF